MTPDVLCIGAVLWDVIGRTDRALAPGSDVPGRIAMVPGGVAMNIAMGLAGLGLRPAVLTAIGRDAEGEALIAACQARGVDAGFAFRDSGLPTDRYMAVEGPGGLFAAIADAHALEAAGPAILGPLQDGRLGSVALPWTGPVALDGNLTTALLAQIAASALFAKAELRVAPASPGKADRLRVLMGHPSAVFHVNREEAGLILDTEFTDSAVAARALVGAGVARAIVTDGPGMATDATAAEVVTALPPTVAVRRVTGAGDTFMAAHLVAERRGAGRADALAQAVAAAADYIGKDPGA
jgi:pseudouridine kinase